ncbi:glycosyltransferase [Alteromonas oceani]|uniref:Glycosyltransferase n=1 Tax=Alteromonas oceani TaxID=2071609 RepID=A0ABV7JSQ4_9ALTE|nr:glycosyltransferase [Alteromonas oceani]
MKILHVISSLKLEAGGVAQGVLSLSSHYPKFGVQATAVTMDEIDDLLPDELNLKVVRLGKGKLGAFSYNPKLGEWLKSNATDFDAVIVDGLWQYQGYIVNKILSKLDVPYYVYTHGMLDPWFKKEYPVKHLKKYIYWLLMQERILRNASSVLFTCEDERILARESFRPYKVRERVVGYGADITAVASSAEPKDFYEKFPSLIGKRIFLFLSRIHEKKGCDLLIQAFAKLAYLDETIHLVMAGPDQTGWRVELEKLAEELKIDERITWTGMLAGTKKWGALKAAEVFILPSHQENFGIAVAEALAVGTPVLISNKVNIWREVAEFEAGVVANDDLQGTIKILRYWLDLDKESKERMIVNSLKCFQEKFEMEKACRNLVDLLKADIK